MYEIYATQGQGSIKVAEFKHLSSAIWYVRAHEGEASFGIKHNDEWISLSELEKEETRS